MKCIQDTHIHTWNDEHVKEMGKNVRGLIHFFPVPGRMLIPCPSLFWNCSGREAANEI